jgi:hypothetical protein
MNIILIKGLVLSIALIAIYFILTLLTVIISPNINDLSNFNFGLFVISNLFFLYYTWIAGNIVSRYGTNTIDINNFCIVLLNLIICRNYFNTQ